MRKYTFLMFGKKCHYFFMQKVVTFFKKRDFISFCGRNALFFKVFVAKAT